MIRILMEKNTFDNIDVNSIINEVVNMGFGDESDVIYYINSLKTLNENGGVVYRLVFSSSIDDIDKKNYGEHWSFDKDSLFRNTWENILESKDEDDKIFLLTAKIPKNFIDIESSIYAFKALPQEMEIVLVSNPSEVKIAEVKETSGD